MYLLSEFKKKEEDNKLKKVAYGTGSVVIGQQAIRSGVPRVLGVRLESHSTSKKNAREILKGGGYLDPNRGGTGASNLTKEFVEQSKKSVHITGLHPDLPKGYKSFVDYDDGWGPIETIRTRKNTPVLNAIYKKMQRSTYRGLAGDTLNPDAKDTTKMFKLLKSIPIGATGLKGRTLYVGGTDKYFADNFFPDADDIALKSNQKVKVYGNRFAATSAVIKKEGLGNLMKANKGRVGAGIAILGGGLAVSGVLASKALGSNGTKKKKKRPKFLNGYRK